MTNQAEVLLTAGAAARRLGISVQHIGRLADGGHLPPAAVYGVGHYRLFRASDLDRWAEQRAARQTAGRAPPGAGHETAASSPPCQGLELAATHPRAETREALSPIVDRGASPGNPTEGDYGPDHDTRSSPAAAAVGEPARRAVAAAGHPAPAPAA